MIISMNCNTAAKSDISVPNIIKLRVLCNFQKFDTNHHLKAASSASYKSVQHWEITRDQAIILNHSQLSEWLFEMPSSISDTFGQFPLHAVYRYANNRSYKPHVVLQKQSANAITHLHTGGT